MTDTQTLPIFRPGCWADSGDQRLCFTAQHLREIADGYNPAVRPAPLVLGHPADDASAPAHGWIERLSVNPAGELVAPVGRISSAFAGLVKAGAYRSLSASFVSPSAPSNPTPGRWYLRHLGALGASGPAVPGLGQFAFGEPQPLACHCADFSAPRGYGSDPDRLALHQSALALAAREGIDYFAAARALGA